MWQVWPFLKACGVGRQERAKKSLQEQDRLLEESKDDSPIGKLLMGKMKGAVDKKKAEEKKRMKKYTHKDPYMILGFGINSFFDMIRVFMVLFTVLTILAIPAIFLFMRQDGLVGLKNYGLAQFSMGNFGYSSANCYSAALLQKKLFLSCQDGTLDRISTRAKDDGTIMEGYGIIKTADETNLEYCLADLAIPSILGCNQALSKATITNEFNIKCRGKASCDFDFETDHPNHPCWNDELNQFFIQVECKTTEDEKASFRA